jgi:hypothetical protein
MGIFIKRSRLVPECRYCMPIVNQILKLQFISVEPFSSYLNIFKNCVSKREDKRASGLVRCIGAIPHP